MIYSLRRLWGFYGTKAAWATLVLGTAWMLYETEGAVVVELYYHFTRPFQNQFSQEDWLMEARFLELQERIIELESQNQQLRTLLGVEPTGTGTETFAPIVGRSADHWWQQLLLGRGENQAIQPGAIVMAPGGLIGRIVSVTPNTSRVLLITDPSSSVGVMISRSRHQGYVRGQGSEQLVMRFFDKEADVRPGDVVTTSPISTLFPPGLPVGVVETVNPKASPVPEAIVRLTAPISYLEWVSIRPYAPVEEKGQAGETAPVSADKEGATP